MGVGGPAQHMRRPPTAGPRPRPPAGAPSPAGGPSAARMPRPARQGPPGPPSEGMGRPGRSPSTHIRFGLGGPAVACQTEGNDFHGAGPWAHGEGRWGGPAVSARSPPTDQPPTTDWLTNLHHNAGLTHGLPAHPPPPKKLGLGTLARAEEEGKLPFRPVGDCRLGGQLFGKTNISREMHEMLIVQLTSRRQPWKQ